MQIIMKVSMAREAGARKVIFASCAPPITNPHIYGIDLASANELIASDKDRFAIAKAIGAEEVIFQDLEDLKAACFEVSPPSGPKDFEVGIFCGKYVTGEVPTGYFEHLAQLRSKSKGWSPMNNANGNSNSNNIAVEQVASNGGMMVSTTKGLNGNAGYSTIDISSLTQDREQSSSIGRMEDISLHNVASDM